MRMVMAMYVFWEGRNFTSNSLYIYNKTKTWFGWDIPVVPNALKDRLFYEGERDPDLCSPKFIAVNNGFGPRKNVRSLLRAFQIVRRNYPGAQLHLIGSSYDQGEEAHAWARSKNLVENVSFRGKVPHDDVITAVREADVLVHPAREESFGNTLVEAMSQKTPVVAGRDSGAVPWVLDNGEAGVLTDVESPQRIAESMLEVTESEKKWAHYSEKGYNHAREQFSLAKTVDKFVSIYICVLCSDK
jgi:glycosyltransferase involved in cell wall biosynthesis